MAHRFFSSFLAAVLTALAFSAAAAVDVNQASQAELESVKGIGPAMSGKIMAARQQSKFKDWPDLMTRVSGIGEKSAQKISGAGLTVGGAAYSATAAMATATAAAPAADKPAKTVRPAKAEPK